MTSGLWKWASLAGWLAVFAIFVTLKCVGFVLTIPATVVYAAAYRIGLYLDPNCERGIQ
jgi:hypothetical protein